MDFKIEKNIPVPAATSSTQDAKYPLDDMEVGDSFLIPVEVPASVKGDKERAAAFADEVKTFKNRLTGAFGRYRKKDGNQAKRFVNRTVEGGVRAFRVEDRKTTAAPNVAAPKPPVAPKPPAVKGK